MPFPRGVFFFFRCQGVGGLNQQIQSPQGLHSYNTGCHKYSTLFQTQTTLISQFVLFIKQTKNWKKSSNSKRVYRFLYIYPLTTESTSPSKPGNNFLPPSPSLQNWALPQPGLGEGVCMVVGDFHHQGPIYQCHPWISWCRWASWEVGQGVVNHWCFWE